MDELEAAATSTISIGWLTICKLDGVAVALVAEGICTNGNVGDPLGATKLGATVLELGSCTS